MRKVTKHCLEGEIASQHLSKHSGVENEKQRDGDKPVQLLEQFQVCLAFGDEGLRVKDEEGAPHHTIVQTYDAEVHGGELGQTKDDTEPVAQTLLHAWAC